MSEVSKLSVAELDHLIQQLESTIDWMEDEGQDVEGAQTALNHIMSERQSRG